MGVKRLKPVTPGQRFMSVNSFDSITASSPEKSLVKGKSKSGGRNKDGKMTMRYIGGGHKRKYRIIDFKRNKAGIPAKVHSIEYDPNRTARIALLYYVDGEKTYIIAPEGLKVGQEVVASSRAGYLAVANTQRPVGRWMYANDLCLGKRGAQNHEDKPSSSRTVLTAASPSLPTKMP